MSNKRSFEEYKTGLPHLPQAAAAAAAEDTTMAQAPRETTPPPLQAPTAKEKKYDRQLRLWAAAGQKALEEAHVLLVVGGEVGSNGSVAGAETLKNLILPSIGHFTIADAATVQQPDLGVNFFLESASMGLSRAEEMTRLLKELNPDVVGHAVSQPLATWLSEPNVLQPYNLILIAAPIPAQQLQLLTTYALASSIPLIHIQCAGFYSTFSVQLPENFPVVDTHPDPDTIQDLRLLAPWPELAAAVDALGDVETMPDHDHGHIPYVLVLLHELGKWKAQHENRPPSNFQEKTAFRDQVRSAARTSNPEGGEENFDEACAAVLKSVGPPAMGAGCEQMFQHALCQRPRADSANFWVIAHAIQQFYDHHGVLPLPGSLPDMKATSADYITLQNIYKSKARADVAEVTARVRERESSLGRLVPVSDLEIEQFCKNAAHVRVLTNSPAVSIPTLRLMQSDPKTIAALPTVLSNWDTIAAVFVAFHRSYLDSDTMSLLTSATTDPDGLLSKTIREVDRCGGVELHNIASLTGGMVAQEAIKLITRQYVPVDGTCIWDGVRSKTEVVKI